MEGGGEEESMSRRVHLLEHEFSTRASDMVVLGSDGAGGGGEEIRGELVGDQFGCLKRPVCPCAADHRATRQPNDLGLFCHFLRKTGDGSEHEVHELSSR